MKPNPAIKEFAIALAGALAAIEEAEAAEGRMKAAQQAAARALANAENARLAADKTIAEAKEFSRRRAVEQDTSDANLKLARDAEKAQHEASLANTKKHEAEAGERHAALQAQIMQAQRQLSEIEGQLAKYRAQIAEIAKL
jgi:chromosome segregation ATPase